MISIEFPPGVTTLLSRSAKISNWRDCNLMRWDDGRTLRPVGGWEQVVYTTPFASRVRKIHKWVALSGILYTAYLCEQHCYIDTGGTLFNATPTGGMTSLGGSSVSGYGEQEYGEHTYGTPRIGTTTIERFSPAWSMDNWGEDLLFMTSYDGRLLRWKPSTPTVVASKVTNSPDGCRQFIVTPERHVMAFQMEGNIGDFGWCSQEDIEDWNFADLTNTAGMYTIEPLSPIMAVQQFDRGILIFTPAMAHIVDWIGLPYIYRRRPVGKVPLPMSAASTAAIPEGIVWVSVEGFWLFNGNIADTIQCPVWDRIQNDMDFTKTVRESHAINLLNRGEIWWMWVDKEHGDLPSRYVAMDYRSKVWAPGYLSRTCGMSYGNERNPLMSDGTKIWKHETGLQYPGALFMPYIESQTLNALEGERWITISKILPDITGDRTALAFSLAKNNDRTVYSSQTYSPQRTVNGHGWVDIRETARDVRLRIDMIRNEDWSTVGPIMFDMKPRGKKK